MQLNWQVDQEARLLLLIPSFPIEGMHLLQFISPDTY
uniref:Uncharacterized protein n=1 Tax=Rhizophora mucronata TaxID=61149 RepID=A0A2P2Q7G7_RHIMU